MRLPRITAKEAEKVLLKTGFSMTRQSGSHRIYKNIERKRVTLPHHTGKILHHKIVKSILLDCNLTLEEFVKLL